MTSYVSFVGCSAVGALLGFILYRLLFKPEKETMYLVAVSISGGVLGAFGGLLLAAAFGFDQNELVKWPVVAIVSAAVAFSLQHTTFHWMDGQ